VTAVVTGAGRGIGLALATALAGRGMAVVGTVRGEPPAVPGVEWARLDVARPASLAAFAAGLGGRPVEMLVCNAGIYPDRREWVERGYPAAMWAETFAVNVTGVFLTVQALLANLDAASRPRVGIIASQLGSSTRAAGGSYIYRASKAAVINLGRNLAADLSPRGIAVGIYHPGWVRTGMGGAAADLDPEVAAAGLVARLEALTPATAGRFETWDGQTMPF